LAPVRHTHRQLLDRRGIGVLGLGHLCTDTCQGAVPALLPFLATQRGYSYAALGSLVLASGITSSFIQPIFGLLADRAGRSWLMPAGVVLAGAGIAGVGLVSSYPATAACIAVSGLGVAAFHPVAARFANFASGAQRGRGMSLFSVGGNAGFAVGPLLTTPLVVVFGLSGTVGLLVLPTAAGVLIVRELSHLQRLEGRSASPDERAAAKLEDDWPALARLGSLVCLRSGIYFGLQAFIPTYFVTQLGASEALGNGALTAMLVAGAAGTVGAGVLVDRVGPRFVVIGSMALLLPLLSALPLVEEALAVVLLALIGFVTIANFSVTVILGQAFLPSRLGLASGVMLGLAIGIGGVAAALLGVLADSEGITAVLWAIAAMPVPALLLALTLPRVAMPGDLARSSA
jgi:FSR family fosmidomycin resistance protein-like MFS transporter